MKRDEKHKMSDYLIIFKTTWKLVCNDGQNYEKPNCNKPELSFTINKNKSMNMRDEKSLIATTDSRQPPDPSGH